MTKMLPSMKIYVPLLWGVFVLFSVESTTTSTPESRTKNIGVESDYATTQPTTAEVLQPATWTSMHKHEEVSPAVEKTVSQTNATEKSDGVISDKGGSSKDAVTTVAADTSISKLPAPTEELKTNSDTPAIATAKGVETFSTPTTKTTSEAQPAPVEGTTRVNMVTKTATEVQPSTAETKTAAEVQPSTAETKTATEVQPSTAETKTAAEVQPSTAETKTAAEAQPSTAETKTATEAQTFLSMTTKDEAQSPHYSTGTFNHTSDQPHLSSASTFTYKTTPETTPATDVATVDDSSQQTSVVTGITSEKPSTASLNVTTHNVSTLISDISSPTSSSPTPEKITSNLSSVSQSASTTSTLTPITSEAARPTSATTESPSFTTLNSTSPGILITKEPNRSPIPTCKPAPAATAIPCETSKNSPRNEFPTCSTRGVAKQCLIVIAVLAVLATIFMLSTIVLCVKLSATKPKAKKKQTTEMTCISSLLPERTRTYTRHRNPISNGVLVLPGYGDSDEEGGDNVTLTSFLPENDRYV